MAEFFTVDFRRLAKVLAFAAPLAVGAGIGLGELQWQRTGATVELPEMCITSTPEGDTSVSLGACSPGPELEI